jgi:hypothetical protein
MQTPATGGRAFLTLDDAYLQGVTLAGEIAHASMSEQAPSAAASPDSEVAAPEAATPSSEEAPKVFCRVSGIWLDSAELREHYHTDWYRYNLKRSMRSLPPVTEAAFEDLVENDALEDELSGSDNEEEEEEEEEGSGGGRAAESSSGGRTACTDGRVALRDSAGVVFLAWRAALLPVGTSAADVPQANLPQHLRALVTMRPRPVWVVVLCRGGHFAAAAFELAEPPKNSKRAEDGVKLLAHKCLHRYVTRRKAGGRQSVADASKSIKSAGSSIRRHNEAMLSREIRDLLHSWALTHLRTAHLVWVAAPGPANSAVLYQGNDAPLSRSDGRLRSIPFNTARPTLSETTRTALRLSRVEFLSEDDATKLLPPPPASAEEQAAARAKERAALEAAAAAEASRRAEAAAAEAAEAAEVAAAEAAAAALPCELHEASAAGDAELTAALLAAGHDPTQTHIKFSFRVAYDVAKSKEVRNAFRRHRALEPDRWDWAAAHVPDALTEEAEKEKEEREKAKAKEKKKRAEKARKERRKGEENARAEAVSALRAATGAENVETLSAALDALLNVADPAALAGGKDEAAEAAAAAKARLSELRDPDWQKRRERERRAEAAERRLGGLTAAQQRFLKGEPVAK